MASASRVVRMCVERSWEERAQIGVAGWEAGSLGLFEGGLARATRAARRRGRGLGRGSGGRRCGWWGWGGGARIVGTASGVSGRMWVGVGYRGGAGVREGGALYFFVPQFSCGSACATLVHRYRC